MLGRVRMVVLGRSRDVGLNRVSREGAGERKLLEYDNKYIIHLVTKT